MIYEEGSQRVFARDGFGALGRWYLLPFSISTLVIGYIAGFSLWVGWFRWGPLGQQWPPVDALHWAGFLLAGVGPFYLFFHLIESVWRITTGHLEVSLTSTLLGAKGLFGPTLSLPNEEIVSIAPFSSIRGEKALQLWSRDGTTVKPVMDEAGQLIEELLPRLSALEHIDIPEEYLKPQYWGKEPDRDIINAAIARAEENRKKKEQQEQKL